MVQGSLFRIYLWQWVIKDYKFKLKWHKRKNFVKILHVKAIWDTKFIKISKIKLSSQVHLHPYIFKTAFSFGKNSTTKKHDWIFSHFVISTNPLCSCISWIFSELFRFFYPWKAWNCLVKDNWTKINQQYPEINRKWKMTEYVKCITLSNHSQSSTSAASFILL